MWQAPEFWQRSGLVSDVLAPLGWAYDALGALRRRFATPYRCAVPVICVGNIVAGGAGKTPVVLSLALWLQDKGKRPHILSRGYGGALPGPLRVDPAAHSADQVGDEPLLLAAAAPTWIGSDRIASAKAAIAAGAELLLLDDGFQNPALHYDLALIVIDGGYGLGNGRVMPAGPLREAASAALARASAVVVIGESSKRLRLDGPPCLSARLAPRDAADLVGRRIFAFAGIGRPAKFIATLQELGATVTGTRSFADHHRFTESELAALDAAARARDALLVTTEKDWVRLPPRWREAIRALKVELSWDDPAARDRLLAPLVEARHG